MGKTRPLSEAHLPTWLKIQLNKARTHEKGTTYLGVGYHLGFYHPETFELEEKGALDVTEEEITTSPSKTLRRLFKNEEHPNADFVDCIPPKRRQDFLRGLVSGVAREDLPERE